ncbi:MAG: energy transducer TonB [Candidatus Krumholzibacteriia bacterium]
MTGRTAQSLFTQPAPLPEGERTLPRLIGLSLLVSTGLGLLLLSLEVAPAVPRIAARAARITFEMPVSPPPPPAPAPAPVDLTTPTVLAQTVDRPAPEAAVRPDVPATAPTPVAEAEAAPPPRRVYGVRTVLAHGLGRDGAAGGLVARRGNALDGMADTLGATPDDLRGELAALSTVERAPVPEHQVRPRYSEALLAARASGTVTARVLVDRDGRVAAVEVTEDIGYDSAAVAAAALSGFRFRPALRHGEPVAVWIIHRIRFEFQE